MFSFFRGKPPYEQSAPEDWRDRWRSLVPPECRNVPVAADGESVVAFILMNHFAVMLQDGLLMEASFFPVCEHFQKAGYHVVWLMRCTQDVYNGYLKRGKTKDGTTTWIWKSPTKPTESPRQSQKRTTSASSSALRMNTPEIMRILISPAFWNRSACLQTSIPTMTAPTPYLS